MKSVQVLLLLLLFCFSSVIAQKRYNLELSFLTDNKAIAPNVKVTFIKKGKTDATVVKSVSANNKGILKLQLSDAYFSKSDSLILEAYYGTQDTYYFDYVEELSKKQFPFKKTVVFEHIVPPTIEEINNSPSIPPPPMVKKRSK